MAPHQSDVFLFTRQTQGSIPSCVVECMSLGNITGCSSNTDYSCICASRYYIDSVGGCMNSSCTPSERIAGETYTVQACAYYGTPLTNTTSSSTNTSVTASGSAVIVDPVIYSRAYINIQAIFSSICGALLILALVSGFLSCRSRYKREQAFSQNRTWTGVGSTTVGGDTRKTSHFFTRTKDIRDPTATFATDNYGVNSSTFGGTTTFHTPGQVSFGPVYGANADYGVGSSEGTGGRFTNRLPAGDMNKSEEWEMEVRKSSIKEEELEIESPTTSKGPGSDIDMDGSIVHLTRLDKDDYHAI
ncbi:hypothetical protein C356_05428 [Cryptococcus neoformans c45]|nr:hypothetical protein C356_05428 [Cryptococcus neoformans var. grubii c45]